MPNEEEAGFVDKGAAPEDRRRSTVDVNGVAVELDSEMIGIKKEDKDKSD